MSTPSLRVLLAVDAPQLAKQLASPLREAGHDEIVVVEARGETALKAARLIHPDLVILSGPLRGNLDVVALSAALQGSSATPIPVLLVADPAELPDLLALYARPADSGSTDLGPTESLDSALEEAEL
jgi:DNA-binding response OmpR family regulator